MDSVPGPGRHPPRAASRRDSHRGRGAQRYRRTLGRLATPYVVDSQGRATPSRYSGDDVDARNRRDLDRPRCRALRPGVEERRHHPAQHARRRVGGACRRQRAAAAAWHTAGSSRRYNGMPIVWQFGVGRERFVVAGRHAAGARADADPAGQQQRSRQAARVGFGRSDGLAVREAVPECVCALARVWDMRRAAEHRSRVRRSRDRVLTLRSRAVAGMAATEWQIRPFVGLTFGGGTTLVDPEHAAGSANIVLRGERRIARRDRRESTWTLATHQGFSRAGDLELVVEQPRHDAHRERHPRAAAAGDRVHASPVFCRRVWA